ncbi:hypothetical protein LG296_20480 (plasmid) [Ureibacillus chungkukjangi]|uniref:hypothetical protein n=2 Tax=Ureibacillus chungkukjangi TaxID=1202712 RepID=UPI000D366245|nr:hypothetical protein [Ureibacillus chungkukjangi]MCM3390425.1 hypothetical protein [Ureibacillus chungkukjangi]
MGTQILMDSAIVKSALRYSLLQLSEPSEIITNIKNNIKKFNTKEIESFLDDINNLCNTDHTIYWNELIELLKEEYLLRTLTINKFAIGNRIKKIRTMKNLTLEIPLFIGFCMVSNSNIINEERKKRR